MSLVVLLKGVNVGGHRTFRPSILAKQMRRFDVVNVGAAGTFVVHGAASQKELRAELERRLPFDTEVVVCRGADVLQLASSDPFAGHPGGRDVVQFVSVLAKRRELTESVPLSIPSAGRWGLRILMQRKRFVLGVYRREMKAIGYLGQLEKMFGVPATTRNWNTIQTIARALDATTS